MNVTCIVQAPFGAKEEQLLVCLKSALFVPVIEIDEIFNVSPPVFDTVTGRVDELPLRT